MTPVKIQEEKDRLEILLPLAGRKSVRTILWVTNVGVGVMFIISLLIGLYNLESGIEYLFPSLAVLIIFGWTLWIAVWYYFGSEKIILERNYISWQHNFIVYTSPVNDFRWKSIEIFLLKDKKSKLPTASYGRLVFKTKHDYFKSIVVQDDNQSKMILSRIQGFFKKMKEESQREKDPVEMLFPHRVFARGTKKWGEKGMWN